MDETREYATLDEFYALVKSYNEIFDVMMFNIENALVKNDIEAKVLRRVRVIYSLFNKNKTRSVRLEDIHDLLAIKVINKKIINFLDFNK